MYESGTRGFESYAPHIKASLLWLGTTNDFHGIMDDTYRTSELISHKNVRYSFTPHMNHRFTPEFAVTRPLWFDQYLKTSFTFAKTPDSKLVLAHEDHVPELQVTPDSLQPVADVHIYYSVDPDARARFWRSVEAKKSGDTWTAKLPILAVDQPLFSFANLAYPLKKAESEPYARPTEQYAISSMLHTAVPKDLQRNDVKATDMPDPLIDDFSHGWQDWYLLEAGNPHPWEFSTRKLTDPKWLGHRLSVRVWRFAPNGNQLWKVVRNRLAVQLANSGPTNFFGIDDNTGAITGVAVLKNGFQIIPWVFSMDRSRRPILMRLPATSPIRRSCFRLRKNSSCANSVS